MTYFKKSLVINVLLVCVAVGASYRAARMIHDAVVLRHQSADVTQKIEELKKKKQELEAYLAEIHTKEAVEREAKSRLNLKKPGEEVVVIIPEQKDTAVAGQSLGFWDKIKSFFKR